VTAASEETAMRRAVIGLAVVLSAAMWGPTAAGAGTQMVIEVFPGPNAIGQALSQANPGDVLNIHAGTYAERVEARIADVTLQAAGDGDVIIDGQCDYRIVVNVSAPGVTLDGLRVVGAGGFVPIEINFSGVDSGRVVNSSVEDTCGNAEYGVNVFDGGSMTISRVTATGFADAGIYIGLVMSTPRGPLVVSNNESFGNDRGIIVENSWGGKILVTGNYLPDNDTTGIWITNSDGVRVIRNRAFDNVLTGIELDSFSDSTLVRRNIAQGHTYDLSNEGGVGNCFLENTYTTSLGDISC
jgi:parallel beta-helix repeat protein